MHRRRVSLNFGTGLESDVAGEERRYALVTGASQGLGRCYALELARCGIDTVLVSLPDSGLNEVVIESRRLGVRCIPFEIDLCDEEALSVLCRDVNAGYPLFMLINNAGTGGTRRFASCTSDYLDRILHLNVSVPTLLTFYLLPNLQRAPEAFILNVASMAAFSPTGFKTVYPATKRFVLQFSARFAGRVARCKNCGKRRYSRTDEDQWRGNGPYRTSEVLRPVGVAFPREGGPH